MEFTITVTGVEELVAKIQLPELLGKPLRQFFNKAALTLQRDAQMATPVDTGRLRASETFEVDPSIIPLWAKVGTNVPYGLYVEEDTILRPGNQKSYNEFPFHFCSAKVYQIVARPSLDVSTGRVKNSRYLVMALNG